MQDWAQWGIPIIVGILSWLGGVFAERKRYQSNKDKKTIDRLIELLPDNFMVFIKNHGFSSAYEDSSYSSLFTFEMENQKPSFFFINKNLDKKRKYLLESIKNLTDILSDSSIPIDNAKGNLFRLTKIHDNPTKEEKIIIDKVNILCDDIYKTNFDIVKFSHINL
jgi:hypothetical protein